MLFLRLVALAAAFSMIALTCVPAPEPRKLWSKSPASESKLSAFEQDDKVGFIDSTGTIVIEAEIEVRIEDVGDFFDGRARIGREGYIDESGGWAIRGAYRWLSDFSDGLARASVEEEGAPYGSATVNLDPDGRVVAKATSHFAGDFSEGLASYEGPPPERDGPPPLPTRGLIGFFDKRGEVAIEAEFAEVGPFVDGLARAVVDDHCYHLSPDGRRLATPTTGFATTCGDAPTDVETPCRVGFIDRSGRFGVEASFESARDFSEGLAAVRVRGRRGFVDRSGSLVIPAVYEAARSFSEGLAAVRLDRDWGYVDAAGSLAIPAELEKAGPFSQSLALVERGGELLFIDRDGTPVTTGGFDEATDFAHGLAAVRYGHTTVAYLNTAGETVFSYARRKDVPEDGWYYNWLR